MFEPLPALIRMERERQNLTQEALAKLANVSRSRLAAVEKGDDNTSLKTLLKVTNTLKMTWLQIGGMYMEGAPPDTAALLAAAEGLETARRVVQEATKELDRASAAVSAHLARVVHKDRTTVPKPGEDTVNEALRQLTGSSDAGPAAQERRRKGSR